MPNLTQVAERGFGLQSPCSYPLCHTTFHINRCALPGTTRHFLHIAKNGHRNTASLRENRAPFSPFLSTKSSSKPRYSHYPPFLIVTFTILICTKFLCLQAFLFANPLPQFSYVLLFTHSFNPTHIYWASTICQALCHMLGISKGTNKRNLCPQPN